MPIEHYTYYNVIVDNRLMARYDSKKDALNFAKSYIKHSQYYTQQQSIIINEITTDYYLSYKEILFKIVQ